MKILCWLGLHKPINIEKLGHFDIAECCRCGVLLIRDNHWLTDSDKWCIDDYRAKKNSISNHKLDGYKTSNSEAEIEIKKL